jgi:hypothetical protein
MSANLLTHRGTINSAVGLRSTSQSLGWIAAEVGIFARLGLDFRITRMETAAPDGLAGLLAHEWEVVEIGAVPIVKAALEGKDPVILLAPEPVAALFILATGDTPSPEALRGGKMGSSPSRARRG